MAKVNAIPTDTAVFVQLDMLLMQYLYHMLLFCKQSIVCIEQQSLGNEGKITFWWVYA